MDIHEWEARRAETPLFRDELPSSPSARSAAPARPARRVPRFLGDGEDEDDVLDFGARHTGLDNLFDDLDDLDDENRPPPAAGTEQAKDKAATFDPLARWQAGEGGTGEGGEGAAIKKKRPRAKLDEDRLLGPSGFPRLREDLKRFKVKGGKGKEREDLKRLLSLYQLWAHQMFPAASFRDAVETIEKVCHKRVLQSQLKMWRAEAHGYKMPKAEDVDEGPAQQDDAAVGAAPKVVAEPFAFSDDVEEEPDGDALLDAALASTQEPPVDEYDEEEAMLREMEGDTSAPAPSARTASKAVELDFEDDDAAFDEEMLREIEASAAPAVPPSRPPVKFVDLPSDDDLDDAAMLEAMQEAEATAAAPQAASTQAAIPEDQEMEDIYA